MIMKIKEQNVLDRPREKAMVYGLGRLDNRELLCLLLGSGTKNCSVESLAGQVLDKTDHLRGLFSIEPEELMEIEGIGQARALMLCAAMELAKRALEARTISSPILGPDDVKLWFQATYGTQAQEHFAVLYLDVKNRLIRHRDLFVGTIDQSLIHPREIFREACLVSASSILLVHNHPSDDPVPSPADLETTRNIESAAQIHRIHLVDHIIVGQSSCFSFRRSGLLEESV